MHCRAGRQQIIPLTQTALIKSRKTTPPVGARKKKSVCPQACVNFVAETRAASCNTTMRRRQTVSFVPFRTILRRTAQWRTDRVGQTGRMPFERIGEYRQSSPFYRGKGEWLVSPVRNMRAAEQMLLDNGLNLKNIQLVSYAPARPGFVYSFGRLNR